MEWEPWVKYTDVKQAVHDLSIPNIKEPPCKQCLYFRPTRIITFSGEYAGVHICHAASMFRDFSCFKNKTQKAEKE